MTDLVKATIKLPHDMREKVMKLAETTGVSQEAVIIQLLDFALSQAPQKQTSKGKLLPDSKSDDY